MATKQEMIDQRGQVADKMKNMTEDIDNWSADNHAEFDTLSNQFDDLDTKITALERAENVNNKLDNFDPVQRPGVNDSKKSDSPFAQPEYENAFEEMVRSKGRSVSNELSVGTDGKGGFTVPESWAKELDRYLYDQTVMRQVATVKQYKTLEHMPQTTGGATASRIGEGQPYPIGTMNFQDKTLGAHKAGSIILVSDELLLDSLYNIQSEVGMEFGEAFGQLDEDDFTNGDGTGNNPSGFLTTAQNALTAASATALTLDELIDLQLSIREVYAKGAMWMMNKTTMGAIRKLKDADGRPLWQPGLQEGAPSMFMGNPYKLNEKMPSLATGNKAVAFGDFSKYVIGDRLGLSLKVLDQTYAADGKVGFRFTVRNDGLLKRTEAIKTITML